MTSFCTYIPCLREAQVNWVMQQQTEKKHHGKQQVYLLGYHLSSRPWNWGGCRQKDKEQSKPTNGWSSCRKNTGNVRLSHSARFQRCSSVTRAPRTLGPALVTSSHSPHPTCSTGFCVLSFSSWNIPEHKLLLKVTVTVTLRQGWGTGSGPPSPILQNYCLMIWWFILFMQHLVVVLLCCSMYFLLITGLLSIIWISRLIDNHLWTTRSFFDME